MHKSTGVDWRKPAYVAGAIFVLYLMADLKFGPRGSFLVAAVFIFAIVALAWWWFFSFAGRVRRGWPMLAKAIGLWQQDPIKRINEEFSYAWPVISRIKREPNGYSVRVLLLPGQTPDNIADHTEGIAHTWRVFRVDASSPSRGVVLLRAWVSDPLDKPFGPVAMGMPGLPGVRDREPVKAPALARYDSVDLGRCDDGSPWVLRLHGTHVMVAGVTGAGKGLDPLGRHPRTPSGGARRAGRAVGSRPEADGTLLRPGPLPAVLVRSHGNGRDAGRRCARDVGAGGPVRGQGPQARTLDRLPVRRGHGR
ncbi:hypothetical protein ACU686_29770 [Yinghuangia aomiensis]